MIARHAELPAASNALTVTVLLPTSSGTVADQDVVPLAVPAPPVDVVHCTDETPALSLAVPLTEILAEETETTEEPGETIVRVGGTVSEPEGGAEPLPVLEVPVPVEPVLVEPVPAPVLVVPVPLPEPVLPEPVLPAVPEPVAGGVPDAGP